jgi:hypothetical protein
MVKNLYDGLYEFDDVTVWAVRQPFLYQHYPQPPSSYIMDSYSVGIFTTVAR